MVFNFIPSFKLFLKQVDAAFGSHLLVSEAYAKWHDRVRRAAPAAENHRMRMAGHGHVGDLRCTQRVALGVSFRWTRGGRPAYSFFSLLLGVHWSFTRLFAVSLSERLCWILQGWIASCHFTVIIGRVGFGGLCWRVSLRRLQSVFLEQISSFCMGRFTDLCRLLESGLYSWAVFVQAGWDPSKRMGICFFIGHLWSMICGVML